MIELRERICCSEVSAKVGRGVLSELSQLQGMKALVHPVSLRPNLSVDLNLPVEDGERGKDLNNALRIVGKLMDAGFTRGDHLLALGGGTVLDVAGFAASIYMRGIDLVNIPTTLLGMVDAGIGGKTGVNFGNAKNMIGTFYQPSLILVDTSFLDSLPKEEVRRGIAEVIKYGVVLDKELYDFLSLNHSSVLEKDDEVMEKLIGSSIKDKLSVVSEDERETKGIRIVLNFGHTVGHAIEAASKFTIPHGLAISVGMVCEAKIAEEMGYAEEGVVEDVLWLLQLFGLPYSIEALGEIPVEDALKALGKDKKRRGDTVLMPFPTRIGSWKAVRVPLETLWGFTKQCLGGN